MSHSSPPPIVQRALSWIQTDPDPETQKELQDLVDQQRLAELEEVMGGSLEFGTAGLRAAVGAGSLRMNRAVVRRTTEGVARYLLRTGAPSPKTPVVVGADGRKSSPSFLRETLGVFAAHGFPTVYFDQPVATPIVAYVARRLNASAAVIITASHNPAPDNGYKLYSSNAVQIVQPADAEIAAEIERCPGARDIPVELGALDGGCEHVQRVSQQLLDDYFREVGALRPSGNPRRDLRVVYTAMHGVGYAPVSRVLSEAGFSCVLPVEEQCTPDGSFPTAPKPNPEEPGALDLAVALAERTGGELIIANDPDADRLAAAVPGANGFKLLSGNQIGLLLADFLLARVASSPKPLVAQSIVSSPMLGSIADRYGAHCERTLTGFKWIWTAALCLMQKNDLNYVFGYEEALGYCAGHLVRDKDGVSAALLFCELTAATLASGATIHDRLAALYAEHGLWVSYQHSITLTGSAGKARIRQAMEQISTSPPPELCGETITKVTDYNVGGSSRPRWLHDTPLVELELGGAGRVLVRPSGTEPKLKLYVDLRREVGATPDVWQLEAEALGHAKALSETLSEQLGLSS